MTDWRYMREWHGHERRVGHLVLEVFPNLDNTAWRYTVLVQGRALAQVKLFEACDSPSLEGAKAEAEQHADRLLYAAALDLRGHT